MEKFTGTAPTADGAAIGVFDSGIGGLSVWGEIRRALPSARLLYFADRAHLPYGERPLAEIADFCRAITEFLSSRGAGIIVLACNTASAAALQLLRREYPQLTFVGMEPAVKPAAEKTRAGKVGVLATAGTFQGAPYAGVVARFAANVEVYEQPCAGLASMIENAAPEVSLREALEKWIAPLRGAGVDQLALACTHYPLILPLIQEIAGPTITVIDPSPAVARQTARCFREKFGDDDHTANGAGKVTFYATAEPLAVAVSIQRFMQIDAKVEWVKEREI